MKMNTNYCMFGSCYSYESCKIYIYMLKIIFLFCRFGELNIYNVDCWVVKMEWNLSIIFKSNGLVFFAFSQSYIFLSLTKSSFFFKGLESMW